MSKIKTWMPVYIGDYLADTMRLSTLQHGAYFLLMLEYWRQGPLPDDMDELSAIARAERKTWDKSIWPTLKRFFSKGEDGLLHQKRADIELGIAANKSSKRSAAANARWSKDESKTDANAYTNASSLNVQNESKGQCKPHCTCASCASASPSPSHISSLRSDIPSLRSGPPEPVKAEIVTPSAEPADARDQLWVDGLQRLRHMTGKPDRQLRPLLGKWLKTARDDCGLLLAIIREASELRPADAVSWVTQAVASRTGHAADRIRSQFQMPTMTGAEMDARAAALGEEICR